MGSRASFAAARPVGSSSQLRWSRPNPLGEVPGLGAWLPPRGVLCQTTPTRAAAQKTKEEKSPLEGYFVGPPGPY